MTNQIESLIGMVEAAENQANENAAKQKGALNLLKQLQANQFVILNAADFAALADSAKQTITGDAPKPAQEPAQEPASAVVTDIAAKRKAKGN